MCASQVIDGGKVKAELASVGEVGAVALDRPAAAVAAGGSRRQPAAHA